MISLLPLCAFALLYLLFAATRFALPLGLGALAALTASSLGTSPVLSFACGITSFGTVQAAAHYAIAAIAAPGPRAALALAYAIPAALAGYSVGRLAAGLTGIGDLVGIAGAGIGVAAVAGAVAARRAAADLSHRS